MKLIVPILVLLFSCSHRPEPEWVTNQPNAENYWFGVGSVEKPFYGNDIREEARSQALNEIASQISVDVSSSFEKVITEHNLSLDEFAKSVVKIRVDNNLPNSENIDFFENKNRYYFLARLSQTQYYETIEKQRHNAVKTTLGLLRKAESEFNIHSFTFLSEAMNEIVPYMDIPIKEEYPLGSGKIVNLYSYIKLLANTFINRFRLVLDQGSIEMKLGFKRGIQLGIKVVDNKSNPIENGSLHRKQRGDQTLERDITVQEHRHAEAHNHLACHGNNHVFRGDRKIRPDEGIVEQLAVVRQPDPVGGRVGRRPEVGERVVQRIEQRKDIEDDQEQDRRNDEQVPDR